MKKVDSWELLTANEYRDKTPAEIIGEGELWEELERKKAKERKRDGGKVKDPENLPEASKGDRRDKVGEKIGVSGRTFEKGKKVKEKAEEGDDTAKREWEKLETGEQSIHGAYEQVKQAEREVKEQQQKEERETKREQSYESADSVVETFHGDFREVRLFMRVAV